MTANRIMQTKHTFIRTYLHTHTHTNTHIPRHVHTRGRLKQLLYLLYA